MSARQDCKVSVFDYDIICAKSAFPIITVYHDPADYPGKYVARLYDIQRPTNMVVVADTYEDVRAAIPAGRMVRLERDAADDPVIVENWV